MLGDFWSDADIIDIYTRRQAIEDGVLVQLSGHGYHRAYNDELRVLDELCVAIEAELDQVHKQACRRLEELGYAEIEYRDSDEYLNDELTANDHYLFTAEGEFDS